ncbi:MAG: hypothetical protein ABFQ62_04460, partial [Patescibacteria group bacterium]
MKKLFFTLLIPICLALVIPLKIFALETTDSSPGSDVVANCPLAGPLDEFFAPTCGEGGCTPVTSTAKGDNYDYECQVKNHVEIVGDKFKQHSNNIHFLYKKSGFNVEFLQDTIWGGINCDGGGKAIYRVYTGNNPNNLSHWGAAQMSTNMSCGGYFDKPASFIVAYNKDKLAGNIEGAYGLSENISPQCNVSGQSGIVTGGQTQLIFQGAAKCCDENKEIAVIRNVTGPGAGEVYVYCKGQGLCTHYQSLDFSDPDNDPQNWNSETDLCRLKAGRASKDKKDPYYLYPIDGSLSKNPDKFYDDLIAQGYQSYCYTPEIDLKGVLNMDDEWQVFTDRLSVASELEYDYSESETPLWRWYNKNKNEVESLFDSLETYWGFRDSSEDDPLLRNISSAPVYSLMTKHDQCTTKMNLLATVERMCDKLQDPSTCALDEAIPKEIVRSGYKAPQGENATTENNPYTWRSLLDQIRLKTDLTCDKIARDDFYDKNGKLTDAYGKELADVLDRVPYYLYKSYRLGFLVIAAEVQDDSGEELPAFNFLPFSFFSKENNLALKRGETGQHIVRIITFKIPDIGTNRDPNSDFNYQDPLQLTANSVLGKDYVDRYRREIESEKNMPNIPGSMGGRINMVEAVDPTSEEYENSELVKTLVNFVNNRTNPYAFYGPDSYRPKSLSQADMLCPIDRNNPEQALHADDLPTDPPADDKEYRIAAEAGLYGNVENVEKETTGANFDIDGGGNLVTSLEEEHIYQDYPPASAMPEGDSEQNPHAFKFISTFSLKKDRKETNNKDPKVYSYLIIPQGYELALVDEALSGLIYDKKQKENLFMDLEALPPFLKLQETGVSFSSNVEKTDALPPEYHSCVIEKIASGETPEQAHNLCKKEVSVLIKKEGEDSNTEIEPRILGGRLGFFTRKIQQALHKAETKMHTWLSELKSTEKYLLGDGLDEGLELEEEHISETALIYLSQEIAKCNFNSTGRITPGGGIEFEYNSDESCSIYQSPLLDIPDFQKGADPYPACDENLYSYISCTFGTGDRQRSWNETLIAHKVDENGNYTPDGSLTACEYVTREAIQAGVSPRFALAEWG